MKKDWTYKKLEEICEKGSSNISLNKIEDNSGDYPLYGASGFVKGIDFFHQSMPYIGIVKDGSGVGRVDVYPPKSSLVGTMQYIFPKEGCELGYLKYLLTGMHLEKHKTGAAIPHIYFKDYGKTNVPLPSIEEQQQIVAELDLLTGMIEKQKAQIEELDKLSQSIFYDMFGDPVINNKGWNTSVLKNVSTLLNGRAYKQEELLKDGKYKVLRVGNFFTNGSYYYSDLELEDNKYCDYGDLLFAWSASFGAFIWQGEKVIYHYHIWKVLFDENYLNKIFYCYLLNTMTNSFMNDLHGIGMMHLTKVGMEQYILPLPPLSLQQEFAAKIEAIEAMKAKVRQSLIESETLFNSRMDYYFN